MQTRITLKQNCYLSHGQAYELYLKRQMQTRKTLKQKIKNFLAEIFIR